MNDQSEFWKGKFGDEYNKRNIGRIETNTALFARILRHTTGIERIIEFGAGTGQNMVALSRLLPNADAIGVEINERAALEIPVGYIFRGSMFDFEPPNYEHAQLAITKGLLIHIAPEDLPRAYDKLYQSTTKYVLIAEYYSPEPREIMYRGNHNKLWARDFAGEMLDLYPDLHLVDYGFAYHRDPNWPQDNINWFLMEKIQ